MKLKNPMLVVTDMDKSVSFYKKVFGLRVIMDFGANKTLTGGLVLQTVPLPLLPRLPTEQFSAKML